MEYRIIVEKTYSDLEKYVNKLIKDGWKPQGGVAISIYDEEYYDFSFKCNITKIKCDYAQAMIK